MKPSLDKDRSHAEFIKEAHRNLRKKAKLSGDLDGGSTWLEHLNNSKLLKEYSLSMVSLATEQWNLAKDNSSRIDWIYGAIHNYFFKDRQSRIEKELRKIEYFDQSHRSSKLEDVDFSVPFSLLDVGSCYNPFAKFEDLSVTAIDLCPANEDVKICDFIQLQITDQKPDERRDLKADAAKKRKLDDSNDETNSKSKVARLDIPPHFCSQIESLEGDSFDIVVFSLFLEYLPTPRLRFEACSKAYRLLKPNGVLCVITPDSKHETANVLLYQLWKVALGNLGFDRVKYEKKGHFHGMVFRKAAYPTIWKEQSARELEAIRNKNRFKRFKDLNFDSVLTSILIPQDFQEYT